MAMHKSKNQRGFSKKVKSTPSSTTVNQENILSDDKVKLIGK